MTDDERKLYDAYFAQARGELQMMITRFHMF